MNIIRRQKIVIIASISLLVIALGVGYFFLSSKKTIAPAPPVVPASETIKPDPTVNTNQPTAKPKPTLSNSIQSNQASLTVPFGTFVSNHHPSLSGNLAMTQEQSVCNTNPGALCEIKFTNGDVTKTLGAKQTDGNGAASWNWRLQDIGLTNGTWQITAVATMGSQSKTAQDTTNLVVQ
ncbi:MAG: hypothetical protein NVS1B7_1520 [Candidatus Saccharimonadales bacterium]